MATITEEPEPPPKPTSSARKAHSKTATADQHQPCTTAPAASSPFQFWFYLTVFVSLITLVVVSLPSFSTQDPKTWFLNLPPILRQHYSKGRIFKVQIAPNSPQVEAFSIQEGPAGSDDRVLIVHGFGCSSFAFRGIVQYLGLKGVLAASIDLPGSGFSDKYMVVEQKNAGNGGGLGGFWEVYSQIQEKGLFWGFDQLIEKGYVDYEENANKVSKREVSKVIEVGPEEMGRVLSQVVNEMGLAPVDLVLHDSALGLSANWIKENSHLVRSVTLLDTVPHKTALPLWAIDVPLVRELVLRSGLVFERVIGQCCLKHAGKSEAEAHRILLKGRDGGRSVAGMGRRVNYSLDLSEWGGSGEISGLPMRGLWSSGPSKEWSQEGGRVAYLLPRVNFFAHSGGPWPQEEVAEEIAESIHQFVTSLPKPTRHTEEETMPEHIKMTVPDDDQPRTCDHHHHEHGHSHPHSGYEDVYGVGLGWTI